jgi:vacuolar iron transporter family protein
VETLDWRRRLKLGFLVLVCRLFGDRAIHLVLEAIEIHGIRKYLTVWETYKDHPLGDSVREILEDEFGHEDVIVSESLERRVDPETIRSVFLGFNDGLVEILGAVSGLFAAFPDASSILMASTTVAVAGGFSMAAGAYVAGSSEREVQRIEAGKQAFLGTVLPVLLGARTVVISLVAGGVVTVLVSAALAFLSGMNLRRRLITNVVILASAVALTYAIGLAARSLLGIAVP